MQLVQPSVCNSCFILIFKMNLIILKFYSSFTVNTLLVLIVLFVSNERISVPESTFRMSRQCKYIYMRHTKQDA